MKNVLVGLGLGLDMDEFYAFEDGDFLEDEIKLLLRRGRSEARSKKQSATRGRKAGGSNAASFERC